MLLNPYRMHGNLYFFPRRTFTPSPRDPKSQRRQGREQRTKGDYLWNTQNTFHHVRYKFKWNRFWGLNLLFAVRSRKYGSLKWFSLRRLLKNSPQKTVSESLIISLFPAKKWKGSRKSICVIRVNSLKVVHLKNTETFSLFFSAPRMLDICPPNFHLCQSWSERREKPGLVFWGENEKMRKWENEQRDEKYGN